MTRSIQRRLLPALAVGVLVLGACGSDSSSSDGTDPVDVDVADTTATTDAAPSTDAAPGSAPDGETGRADCAATIEPGVLTVGTGEPAFFPWVIDDDPTTGQGFEAAVAYAVAAQMGYEADAVKWVRTTFDEAIQPGPKSFDFNLQQYSITPERAENIDFSAPYYTSNQAIVALEGSAAVGATSIADLKDVKFGAQAGTTSLAFIEDVIQPTQEAFVYDDNVGAKAALEANQIDAAVFDLPTALFVSAVEIEGSTVIGQFAAEAGGATDQFGMVLEKGSALKACVDEAIAAITESGELQAITDEWLAGATGVSYISTE